MYKSAGLLLSSLLCSLLSSGQLQEVEMTKADWITAGEVKWLGKTKASLKYSMRKDDTTYLLHMQDEEKLKNNRDMTVVKYFSIRFSGQDNTAGKLYELFISFFTPENRRKKEFQKVLKLGDEMLHIQHYGKLTGPAIMVSTKENHIILTQKEINKLFGKQ